MKKYLFIITILIFSLSLYSQTGTIKYYNESVVDSLKIELTEMSKEIDKLKVEKNYFNTILQSITQTYITLIAIILSIAGLISFLWFQKRLNEIRKIRNHFDKYKSIMDNLISDQKIYAIQSDYSYANICNLLGGLEFNTPYNNYNKSFFYYMRCIKYLLKSDKINGIHDNLDNALNALRMAITSPTVSTQDWELKEHHILEIRKTSLSLVELDDESIKSKANILIKDFETNINKIIK